MLFLDPFLASNCSIQGSNFQKFSLRGFCPPEPSIAAANFFKVYAVIRLNLKKNSKKVLQVGENIFSGEGKGGMISKLNIYPCENHDIMEKDEK